MPSERFDKTPYEHDKDLEERSSRQPKKMGDLVKQASQQLDRELEERFRPKPQPVLSPEEEADESRLDAKRLQERSTRNQAP